MKKLKKLDNLKNGNLKKGNRDRKKAHKQDEDCESCYILDPYLTVIIYVIYYWLKTVK